MNLWADGRSGQALCLAGNLVLAHLRDTQKEVFQERKGNTFRGRATIWVGRSSSDAHLGGNDRHWTNLSLDQHREVMTEANLEGSKVKYLLITASRTEPVIHYWIIPGEVLDRIAFAGQEHPEFTFSLHIREVDGKYEIEGQDVTRFHHLLRLSHADADRLHRALVADRQMQQRRAARKRGPTNQETNDVEIGVQRRNFDILLRGGRSAILSLPLPAAEVDLQRIKGWIDLMSDVLTEAPGVPQATTERRVRAMEALAKLHQQSVVNRTDKLSDDEIESEIHAARRERDR